MKIKRELKKRNKKRTNEILKKREQMITKYILEEETDRHERKIRTTIENLRREGSGLKEDTFWQFKRKMENRPQEAPSAIQDDSGKIVEEKRQILEEYKAFYGKLFEKRELKSLEGKLEERRISETLESIELRAKEQESLQFEDEDIKKGIKVLKRRKAADCQGWKNEMIIFDGREMERSIRMMFNRILQKNIVLKEWECMRIKSTYKNRGSRMHLKNRRGLFMTSIISKLFEKTLMERIGNRIHISEYQFGGKKRKSTKDNWIIMMAIIDRNKCFEKKTYAFFADAEKYFDKLWLEDSLVQMNKNGVREREVTMLRAMNREARIEVETPSGDTDKINVKNIVKQETIYSPQLCCVSTCQVNDIKETPVTMISPTVECKAMVYRRH